MSTAVALQGPADDAERLIVASICAGDGRAFETLMRQYNRQLYRVARSILRDDFEAEDALHEAYWKAYQALENFRSDCRLSTWLTRIVINESLGRLRRAKRRLDVIQLEEAATMETLSTRAQFFTETEAGPDAQTWRAEIRAMIEHKLDALPDTYRVVFVLRAVEEVPAVEVAEILGIPEATVRTRFFRARRLLREAMANEIDRHASDVFSFGGERCDRIVARVLSRLGLAGL